MGSGSRQTAALDIAALQADRTAAPGGVFGRGGTGTHQSRLGGIGIQVHMVGLGRIQGHVPGHLPAAGHIHPAAGIGLIVRCTGQVTADETAAAAVRRGQAVAGPVGMDVQALQLRPVSV